MKHPNTLDISNHPETRPESPPYFLHWLNRPGVKVVWENGKLRLGVKPGALSADEAAILLAHKEEVGGWLLLHKLWEAGYSLRLQPSEYGPGYVLIPTGKPSQPVDFPALFELYDTFHDSAVALLLDACRLLKIDPMDWPKAAERFVREAALRREECPRPKRPARG
ncbi:hypothetical protein THTE_2727 [Thermogutta terrifontis]|uniref:Uncharacterized protein n=1 Tax=Thermogutta terrifontis TaxID=1331910 RepID=A0A286RH90_9BACT|nr:hypothetical protein [Thermogutta terrifontis]ASV75329.1 hypothetical protein THTE_2727 [Thermogutta terrifontis]